MHELNLLNRRKEKFYWAIRQFRNVMFTGEKKFIVDGRDGLYFDWHDIRQEPELYSKIVHGGRSAVTWGAILNMKKLA